MALTGKRQVFIEAYLDCLNATEAARRAGYARPKQEGCRLLTFADVAEVVKAGMEARAMPKDEIVARLAEQARGSLADFLKVDETTGLAFVDLRKAGDMTRLIKKLRITKAGIEIELYDAQAALVQLGRVHGLFVDKVAPTTPDGAQPWQPFTADDLARAADEAAKFEQEKLSGSDGAQ